MVGVLAFYSHSPGWNPAKLLQFLFCNLFEKNKKEAEKDQAAL